MYCPPKVADGFTGNYPRVVNSAYKERNWFILWEEIVPIHPNAVGHCPLSAERRSKDAYFADELPIQDPMNLDLVLRYSN